jgi:Lipid-droplet associated hydrolase
MPFSSEIRNTSSKEVLPVKTSFYVDRNNVQGALRVLWWPPRAKTRSEITSILVFTCGFVHSLPRASNSSLMLSRNPGIPDWYIQFLSLIREQSTPGLAIAACGHIGHAHDLKQPVSSSSLSLGSQIEAHAAVLEGLYELFPNARFVSLSHSIGAYISLKVSRVSFDYFGLLIITRWPTISLIWSPQ